MAAGELAQKAADAGQRRAVLDRSLNRRSPPEKVTAWWRMLDLVCEAATSTTSLSTRVVTVVRKKLKNSPTSDMTTFSPERKDRRLR